MTDVNLEHTGAEEADCRQQLRVSINDARTVENCYQCGYIIETSTMSAVTFDAHCCHMGTAIKHRVPDRVKPSFVIFNIRTL